MLFTPEKSWTVSQAAMNVEPDVMHLSAICEQRPVLNLGTVCTFHVDWWPVRDG